MDNVNNNNSRSAQILYTKSNIANKSSLSSGKKNEYFEKFVKNIELLDISTRENVLNILMDPTCQLSLEQVESIEKGLKLGVTLLKEMCKSSGLFHQADINNVRLLLLDATIRSILNTKLTASGKPTIPAETKLSQHDILDVILPVMTPNQDEMGHGTRRELKFQILSFLDDIHASSSKIIKQTRDIEDKINIFLDAKYSLPSQQPRNYNWKANEAPKGAANYKGICEVNTNNYMASKAEYLAKTSTARDTVKQQKFFQTKFEIMKKLAYGDGKIKSNYSAHITESRNILEKEFNLTHTATIPFQVTDFSAKIKQLIKDKFAESEPGTDTKLFFDLTIPPNLEEEVGHSTFFSIAYKKIAGQDYYSLESYDSNYQSNNKQSFSQSKDLLIPKNQLENTTIPWPLDKDCGELAMLELFSSGNKELNQRAGEIKPSGIPLALIIKNPLMLSYCNENERLEYLTHLQNTNIAILGQIFNKESLAQIIVADASIDVKIKLLDLVVAKGTFATKTILTHPYENGATLLEYIIAHKSKPEVGMKVLDLLDKGILNWQDLNQRTNNRKSIAESILKNSTEEVRLKFLDVISNNAQLKSLLFEEILTADVDKNFNSLAILINLGASNDVVKMKFLDLITGTGKEKEILEQTYTKPNGKAYSLSYITLSGAGTEVKDKVTSLCGISD